MRPARPIPLLIGGHSDVALGRAGRLGDGWLAQQSLNELQPDELVSGRRAMLASAERAGRDPGRLRLVLRIVDSAGRADELAAALPALARAGVSEVIVDLRWDGSDQAADVAALRAGAERT